MGWTCYDVLFFFFSSRRRHTRFKCDWSSDVCSSDLYSLSKPPWLFPGKSRHPLRILIQNPCNRRRWILHDRSFPTIPILAGFHNVEQEIWANKDRPYHDPVSGVSQ